MLSGWRQPKTLPTGIFDRALRDFRTFCNSMSNMNMLNAFRIKYQNCHWYMPRITLNDPQIISSIRTFVSSKLNRTFRAVLGTLGAAQRVEVRELSHGIQLAQHGLGRIQRDRVSVLRLNFLKGQTIQCYFALIICTCFNHLSDLVDICDCYAWSI